MKDKKYRVLVVDDEEQVRNVLAAIFERGGALVKSAANLTEVMEILNVFRPNFIITDLLMPGGSGVEVKDMVKKIYPDVPVVIITGYYKPENYQEKDWVGVFRLLSKPISAGDLLAVFREAVGVGKHET